MSINYNKHYIDKKDIIAVTRALKSNFITQGTHVLKFEEKLKDYFKANYCTVVSNGTAALYIVLNALNLKKGDIICSSAITFFAGASAAKHNNLKNHFIDIDPKTLNLDINKLENFLKKTKKVKAVIATDYAGQCCDWKRLKRLSKKYKFYLINDNCHAIGSKYFGDIGYASKYADFVIHSYHAVKNITSGEGGSILYNNKKYCKKIVSLRNHGLIKKKNNYNPNWPYSLDNLSFNFRITDFQCALGISQLQKLKKFVLRRRKIAQFYYKGLSGIKNIELPEENKNIYNSYHLYPIRINFKKAGISKINLLKKMSKFGINLQVHYYPVYKHKIYQLSKKTFLNNAENFFKETVSLPIYFSLKNSEVKKIISLLKKLVN